MSKSSTVDQEHAIAQIATHVCRQRPKLRISPNACNLRRKRAGGKFSGVGFSPFSECEKCAGPLPFEELPATEFSLCRSCGRTGDEVKFYPSRQDRCAECIKADNRRNGSNKKSYTVIDEQEERTPVKEATEEIQHAISEIEPDGGDPSVEIESKDTCVCLQCGAEFSGYKHGSVNVTKTCQTCIRSRMSSRKSNEPNKITLVFDEQDEELLSGIGRLAKRQRRTVDAQILTVIEERLQQESEGAET